MLFLGEGSPTFSAIDPLDMPTISSVDPQSVIDPKFLRCGFHFFNIIVITFYQKNCF